MIVNEKYSLKSYLSLLQTLPLIKYLHLLQQTRYQMIYQSLQVQCIQVVLS